MELKQLKEVYSQVDDEIGEKEMICQKGCAFCCHQSVTVAAIEGSYIESFVLNKMPKHVRRLVKDNVKRWFSFFNANTPERQLTKQDLPPVERRQALEGVPCPFLVNNVCSIYPVRPLVCRTYFVNDDVSLCQQNPSRDGDIKGRDVRDRYFKNVFDIQRSTYMRLLPYSVAEKMEYKGRLKRIQIDFYARR